MLHVRKGCLAAVCAAVALAPPAAGANSGGAGLPPPGGLDPTGKRKHVAPPLGRHAHGRWLRGVTLTEYWPAPESWFIGRLVAAPGLAAPHRIDWLYSALGVSMQGEGIGLDGQLYHISAAGDRGWVTSTGMPTGPADGWSTGVPFWRAGGYWRNKQRAVTFPLELGGWSNGRGRKYVAMSGVSFATGASLPLRFYRSIAVDPDVIPLGSRVYIPAYRHDGFGGWFVAQDTGGAISGRHVDVYRSPPASPGPSGRYLARQRVFVVKPHR
jgi:3D (Asp-Asp-Asp) domain-containing protein